jgi:DNA invertase Pin-like site-specific DNA recombinase
MRPAIGYIRVSTAKQGRSGLGIEAQQEALQRFGDAEGYGCRVQGLQWTRPRRPQPRFWSDSL